MVLGNADRVLTDVRKLIGEARELDKTVRDTLHEYKERKKENARGSESFGFLHLGFEAYS